MLKKIKDLIKSIPLKEIETAPCFRCYTCNEVDTEYCGSIMKGYRLQWFENFNNISPEDEDDISCFSYPENDFYLDFKTKKDLAKIISELHKSEKENIKYVLDNPNRFEFELIKFK